MGAVDDLHDFNLESSGAITVGDRVETNPLKDVDVDVDADVDADVDIDVSRGDVFVMYPSTPDLQRETKIDLDLGKDGDPPTPATPPGDQAASDQHVQVSEEGGEGVQWKGPVENGSNGEIEGSRSSDKEVGDLVELISNSNLNPMAREFVPPKVPHQRSGSRVSANSASGNRSGGDWKRKNNNHTQRRRFNNRTSMAQREEIINRTVYVCDVEQHVTEELLATTFLKCGQVVDCRICGDPNSVLRIAFIEFTDPEDVSSALGMTGTMFGYYPIRVLRSKTAIAPVNPTYLPRSDSEREICSRTIYCTNIDRKVNQQNVKNFFQSICGEVCQVKLLGEGNYPTRIGFVEFVSAPSAIMALSCSGALLGSVAIRISPSKTPIRSHAHPRSTH